MASILTNEKVLKVIYFLLKHKSLFKKAAIASSALASLRLIYWYVEINIVFYEFWSFLCLI